MRATFHTHTGNVNALILGEYDECYYVAYVGEFTKRIYRTSLPKSTVDYVELLPKPTNAQRQARVRAARRAREIEALVRQEIGERMRAQTAEAAVINAAVAEDIRNQLAA